MKLEEICKALLGGRIIDLSKKVYPGKAEGPLDTGKRRYEIRKFTFPPGEIMHWIEMESHISTHVEAPSHFVPVRHGRSAHDVSEVNLKNFFGMAILVDCKELPPRTKIDQKILKRARIRRGDIVLFGRSLCLGEKRPYLSKGGIEFLLEKNVKMIGVDDTVFPENPKYAMKDIKKYWAHDLMLSNEIPIIEGLANLEELKHRRFFFFGFPPKMGGLESFPIRAVAVEIKG